jgi:hypothetical protein
MLFDFWAILEGGEGIGIKITHLYNFGFELEWVSTIKLFHGEVVLEWFLFYADVEITIYFLVLIIE